MTPDPGRGPKTAETSANDTWTSKRCARCGRGFLCGADTPSCWCDLVRLSDEQRASLAALRLSGCLCRECLEAL
jgi:hypothetical protein